MPPPHLLAAVQFSMAKKIPPCPHVSVWGCCSPFAFFLFCSRKPDSFSRDGSWMDGIRKQKIHGLFMPCFYALDWKLNIARTGNSTGLYGAECWRLSPNRPVIFVFFILGSHGDSRPRWLPVRMGPACMQFSPCGSSHSASASPCISMHAETREDRGLHVRMCPHVPTSHWFCGIFPYHQHIYRILLAWLYIFFCLIRIWEGRFRLLYCLKASVYHGFKILIRRWVIYLWELPPFFKYTTFYLKSHMKLMATIFCSRIRRIFAHNCN